MAGFCCAETCHDAWFGTGRTVRVAEAVHSEAVNRLARGLHPVLAKVKAQSCKLLVVDLLHAALCDTGVGAHKVPSMHLLAASLLTANGLAE